MLEELIGKLIDALDRNTNARMAGAGAPAATTTAAATPAADAAAGKTRGRKAGANETAPASGAPATAAPTASNNDEKAVKMRSLLKQYLDLPSGGATGMRDLLTKYGATKLSEVKPERYDDLINEVSALINGPAAPAANAGTMFD